MISTDIFSTKPLWFAIDNGELLWVMSLLYIVMVLFRKSANTTRLYTISTLELIEERTVWDFDLTQHKTTFEDWNTAFENAIQSGRVESSTGFSSIIQL